MADEIPDSIQRWTAKRRVALVLRILKGQTSVAQVARQHGLTVAEVEDWRTGSFLVRKTPCALALRMRRPSRTNRSKSSNRKSGNWFSTMTTCGRHSSGPLWPVGCPTSEAGGIGDSASHGQRMEPPFTCLGSFGWPASFPDSAPTDLWLSVAMGSFALPRDLQCESQGYLSDVEADPSLFLTPSRWRNIW